jgi:hypothetical protein
MILTNAQITRAQPLIKQFVKTALVPIPVVVKMALNLLVMEHVLASIVEIFNSNYI